MTKKSVDRGPAPVIRDRTSVAQGFSQFSRSSVESGGKDVIFEYPAGASYRVPVDYLVSWFQEPHRVRGVKEKDIHATAVRSRRHFDNLLVRVYLSDGREYDVAWDVVLLACEPAYEHYGGFTAESKKLTEHWQKKNGSFRAK